MSENGVFVPTKILSHINDHDEIDLGLLVMCSIGPKELHFPLRNEFYLDDNGDLIYETYSTLFKEPVAVGVYKVVRDV